VRLFAPGFQMGEHQEIIDALRTGDGARARAAAVNHILMTQDRVRKRETTGFSLTAVDGARALPQASDT